MDAIGGVHALRLFQALQLFLDLVDGVGVEQLAQIGVAQQLAKLVLIDEERLRASLSQRRVAVIDVVRDIAEEQR
ncbi:MAG TPA: hypothetical protein VMF89_10000 [Polyangiales bacterium]|nr:hypothetical protein [Polyangiales bacterium]